MTRSDFASATSPIVAPLALVPVTAGAEHRDQPVLHMRTKRFNRSPERVGSMGIVDIDRRAASGDRRTLEPPAHRLQPGDSIENSLRLAAGSQDQPGGHQRIRDLVGPDKRQLDLLAHPGNLDLELLPELAGGAGEQANLVRPALPR